METFRKKVLALSKSPDVLEVVPNNMTQMNTTEHALQNARWSEDAAKAPIKRAIAALHDAIAELDEATFHFADAGDRNEVKRVQEKRKAIIEIIKTLSK